MRHVIGSLYIVYCCVSDYVHKFKSVPDPFYMRTCYSKRAIAVYVVSSLLSKRVNNIPQNSFISSQTHGLEATRQA